MAGVHAILPTASATHTRRCLQQVLLLVDNVFTFNFTLALGGTARAIFLDCGLNSASS